MTDKRLRTKKVYNAPLCDVVMLNAAESVLQASPLLLYGVLGGAGAEQEYNVYGSDF
ncbi:MAG: hypothetical protein IKX45_01805 [Bacteroidales bacterium]|nr:hypothetical protein [Bacteroidales bacterium]